MVQLRREMKGSEEIQVEDQPISPFRKLAEYVSLCGRTCQERYRCIHNHSAHSRGVQVIIAGAGGASHLSAMS
ncbi:hypothetical protein HID58_087799 [Brassica napus]|uniref:Uncharacterized protein n=1 Tax=Brassica napus TaxID=3708 RepID=A0ABQ7XUC6_BRANA|nr:hypothetical protein HID58_087799 [Brassica napus]